MPPMIAGPVPAPPRPPQAPSCQFRTLSKPKTDKSRHQDQQNAPQDRRNASPPPHPQHQPDASTSVALRTADAWFCSHTARSNVPNPGTPTPWPITTAHLDPSHPTPAPQTRVRARAPILHSDRSPRARHRIPPTAPTLSSWHPPADTGRIGEGRGFRSSASVARARVGRHGRVTWRHASVTLSRPRDILPHASLTYPDSPLTLHRVPTDARSMQVQACAWCAA
jgi:hypothetical protein